jgi:hypothetical protein
MSPCFVFVLLWMPHYLHMANLHLVKLQHSNLPRYLGLTSTFKRVGLIPVANFPSDPRPCCSRLPSLVFRPNRKLCLVRRLDASKPTPQASNPHLPTPMQLFKPSLTSTYVYEHVKLGVEPNPTLRLITQATTWATPWWSELGFRLSKPPHLRVRLEGHVTLPHFRNVNVLTNVSLGWPPLAFSPPFFWTNYFLIDRTDSHCVFVFSSLEALFGVSFIFTRCIHLVSSSNPPYSTIICFIFRTRFKF